MSAADPQLTWDLAADVRQLFAYPFMVNAFRAGTIVAVVAGVVGWFVVLRRQAFAAHTLAVVGFPGATGALLLGVSATLGSFVFAVAGAVVVALAPRAARGGFDEESAVTATVLAVALACGYLFASLNGAVAATTGALLFGSFLGITTDQVLLLLALGVAALALIAVMGRPLFFATVDPDVARARAVPVRALSVGFLAVLAIAAAAASQITGALLVFALLVVPAAAAQAVTSRPLTGLVVTVLLGLLVTWSALAVAYYWDVPVGFLLTSIAFTVHLLAVAGRRLRVAARR